MIERVLTGGNAGERVVRVGATVRKPATAAVQALLEHLHVAGFTAAPKTHGRDTQDRLILEYVPGQIAERGAPLSQPELGRLGALIRELHDAIKTFDPPVDARWDVLLKPDREELICHNDLAPWNLVRDGDRWVFIDWDGAGPGSALWDLAYAAQSFVPMQAGGDPDNDGPRLRALIDGYGLDEQPRRELPALMATRTKAMYELLRSASRTGRQPWVRLYVEGHGDHWHQAAVYVERHAQAWTNALLN
jgi:Ser/Thr protein kinase RdoA (MazF antagonist)